MQMTRKRECRVVCEPHTLALTLGITLREYHSESLGFLRVNLCAVHDFVTAVNYHNIRVVFVCALHV